MTNKEYHQLKEVNGKIAISGSNFNLLAKSPLHFTKRDLFKLDSETLAFGSAFHCAVLEPQKFNNEFAIEPTLDKRTKEGKKAQKEFLDSVGGKTVISEDDFEAIQKMATNVIEIAGDFIAVDEAIIEKPYIIDNKSEWFARKCKPDIVLPKQKILVDLKTTSKTSKRDIAQSIADYRYYIQGAWNMDCLNMLDGMNIDRFILIFVSKTAPYMVDIFELDAQSLERGRMDYYNYLDHLEYYLANGRTDKLIQPISLPTYF